MPSSDQHNASDAVARYEALLHQDVVGIAEIAITGRYQRVNRKFCELTGFAERELLQRNFRELTRPEDLPVHVGHFESVLADGIPLSFEKRCLRKDGSVFWSNVSMTRIGDDPAQAVAVLAVVVDLSDVRRAERAAEASAEQYQVLLNSIDAGFCVVEMLFDERGRPVDYVFLETNAAFEAVSGLHNALHVRMRELAPTHEQHWFEIYGRVALTGEPVRFEQEARALKKWFNVYASRVGDSRSRKVAILFEDITARRLAERHRAFLADLGERLVRLHEASAIMHATAQAVGCYLDVDRCFFVDSREEDGRLLIGDNYVRPGTESIAGEKLLYQFGDEAWWREVSHGGLAVGDVYAHPLTSAHTAAYDAVGVRAYIAQPFRADGTRTGVFGATEARPREWTTEERKVMEDVMARVWPLVERARGEAALLEAHAALEQRVAERTVTLQETISELEAYSYSISHDLRAPLRAMNSYANILINECASELNAEAREYLRRIMVAGERMDRLIRDVLIYSRIGREQMSMERIELGSFITSLIESYPGLSVPQAEIELVSPLAAVVANPAGLTQCVANLLGNAIKFVAPGTKPRVRIWTEPAGAAVRLCFRDNGIGVTAEAREKIFGMFYQVDPSRDGTGVGLAVVRRAVQRMGGSTGVRSTPGEGSTFWLELMAANSGTPL